MISHKIFFTILCFLGFLMLSLSGKPTIRAQESVATYDSMVQQGQDYLAKKQWYMAVEIFAKLLKLNNSPEILASLAKAELGMAKYYDRPEDFLQQSKKNYNLRESIKHYQQAVKSESSNLDWKFELADAYLYRKEPKDLKRATELLEQVRVQDPTYRNVLIRLGELYQTQKDSKKAGEVFDQYATTVKTDARVLLQKAVFAAQEDSLLLAETYYLQAVELKDSTSQAIVFDDIKMLFSDQEFENYKKAENKIELITSFWLARDPTPKTPENERVQEHLRRVAFACNYFHKPESDMRYDDRGLIYVKYGDPSYRYMDMGGGVSNEDGAMKASRVDFDYMKVLQNESWTYDYVLGDNKDGYVFEFANKSKNGYSLIQDLREAVMGSVPLEGSIFGGNMIFNGSGVDLMKKIYRDRADVNYAYYGRLAYTTTDAGDFMSTLRDFKERKMLALRGLPAEWYKFDRNPPNSIPLQFDHACFRGENGKTRYEIYYGFPLSSIKFTKSGKYLTKAFNQEITVRESADKSLYSDSRTIELELEQNKNLDKEQYTGQINFEIPPQRQLPIAHFTVHEPANKQMTLAYWRLPNRNFAGDSLMVSDTKFSYLIIPSREDDPFTRNGLRVVPQTTTKFSKQRPVQVYFEVYNLQPDEKNNVTYKLQCKMQRMADEQSWGDAEPAGKKKKDKSKSDREKLNESLSLENEMNGSGPQQSNYLTIDMSKLREGVYDFSLTIIDVRSKQQASSQRNIVLMKE